MPTLAVCTTHNLYHLPDAPCPYCAGIYDPDKEFPTLPGEQPGQGCGRVAPRGLKVDGTPVGCWKHYTGHCLAKHEIRFINGVQRG